MSGSNPLLSEMGASYLAMVVNRVAASFDVSALSTEEVVEICVLLDRFIAALTVDHREIILLLYVSLFKRFGPLPDDDDEPGGSLH